MTQEIDSTLEVLNSGGIILYPTDTVWGLGCDATNSEACKKLFEIKKRKENQSMLILVDSIAMLERYVVCVPDIAYDLIEISDKPITIIYPNARNISDLLVATDGSIGIRVCETEFYQKLMRRFRKPIVSTSANYSGDATPENYSQINPSLRDKTDYIVQINQSNTTINKASGIIKINADNSIEIIRK